MTPIKNYSNARKLFRVRNLNIGAMSYGVGNIGNRSIQGLMGGFRLSGKAKTSVQQIARDLFTYFKSTYDGAFSHLEVEQRPQLGFYVAGYSKGKPFSEEWEFLFPRDNAPQRVRPDEQFGASWRGIDIPFTRTHLINTPPATKGRTFRKHRLSKKARKRHLQCLRSRCDLPPYHL